MNVQLWSPGFVGFGGGIAVFSRDIVLTLQELGHGIRLVGKDDVPGAWHGLPLTGVAYLPKALQKPVFALIALASSGKHKPAFIVSMHINFGPIAHWVKRVFGIQYVLVGYGLDLNEKYLSPARRSALRAADLIVTISAWTRQCVLDVGGIDESRVEILPPTFDESRFHLAVRPDKLLRRYQLHDDQKVVLSVARLNPGEAYKGYDRIIRALPAIQAACGPVRFLLVGRGDDWSRIESLALELGVAHAVTFAGFVPDDELADHYRLADVFAMPSTGEGFGIVFLEAMACGTPVLAGNCDGSVDALDNGRFGRLVDPKNVDAIAQGIIDLLNKQGDPLWFDRPALSQAVVQRFGRQAFRSRLREIFPT